MDNLKIVFSESSLAETYALTTLARYLSHQAILGNFKTTVAFDVDSSREGVRKELVSQQFIIPVSDADICVGAYSGLTLGPDIVKKVYSPSLFIDIALLKNGAIPLSVNDKMKAKAEAGINPSTKVMVVANLLEAHFGLTGVDISHKNRLKSDLVHLMEIAAKYAELIVLDDRYRITDGLSKAAKRKLHESSKYGVLRGYLSFADAAVTGGRLGMTAGRMHNFVEAVQHGKFFCITKEDDEAYFGFNQLTQAGSIVISKDLKSLEDAVVNHLSADINMVPVHAARDAHFKSTRDVYFPVIQELITECAARNPIKENAIDYLLSVDLKGLKLRQLPSKQVVVYHPSSNWLLPDGSYFHQSKEL